MQASPFGEQQPLDKLSNVRREWAAKMEPQFSDPSSWTLSYAADISGVLGLVIGVVGFGITIWQTYQAKTAAEAAKIAATAARSSLLRVDSIATITAVIAGFEDLRRLHRAASWDGMPERYGIQKRQLISIKTANPDLSDGQKSILQSAINQLSTMEREIEKHLAAPTVAPDAARLNQTVSKQADSLTRLLTELKIEDGTL